MKPTPIILATATLVTALQQAGIWGLIIPTLEDEAEERKQVCFDAKYDEKIRTEMMTELYKQASVKLAECSERCGGE